jgi:hypothetical protein
MHDFDTNMTQLHRDFSQAEFDTALERARRLKEEVWQARVLDAAQLGWVVFYELRCLYAMGRGAEAYALMGSKEREVAQFTRSNEGWMCSVAAELASDAGQAEEAARWGEKCFVLRYLEGDTVSAQQCCATVCVLLRRMDRPDLNAPFAAEMVRAGREADALHTSLAGLDFLLDNAAHSQSAHARGEVLAAVDEVSWITCDDQDLERLQRSLKKAERLLGYTIGRRDDGRPRRGRADRYWTYDPLRALMSGRAFARHAESLDRQRSLTVRGFEQFNVLLQLGFERVGYESHKLPDGCMFWISDEHAAAIGRNLTSLKSFHLALTTFEGAGFDMMTEALRDDVRIDELVINHRSADGVTLNEATGLARLVTALGCRKLSWWAHEYEPGTLDAFGETLAQLGNETLEHADICDTSLEEPNDVITPAAVVARVEQNRAR